MSEMDAVAEGPMLRSHTNRVVSLLRSFKEQGRTLAECTERQRLGMNLKTLQKYCRDAGISFPDYTPVNMRSKRTRGN